MKDLRPPRPPGGRSRRRAGAALAAAVLAALALALTGGGAALAAPLTPTAGAAATPGCAGTSVSPATWMHDLGPCISDRKLGSIVIPGTHDSTTYSLGGTDLASSAGIHDEWHTQDEDLAAQLNGGMRAFDIRVEGLWTSTSETTYDYYAHHGSGFTDGISSWLDLPGIFSDIAAWATAPDHGHEIIILGLTITQNGFHFPDAACRAFGQQMGDALVIPSQLQANFDTTDPSQVTLNQLWSLPDPNGYARVIIDAGSNNQCMQDAADAAAGIPIGTLAAPVGNWAPSSGYYANQCTAGGMSSPSDQQDGVQQLVLAAVKGRNTGPLSGEPNPLEPANVGGLYTLDIQATPAQDACLLTSPWSMGDDERTVLQALYSQWLTDSATRQNLNIVAGDYVEYTNLYQDAITMDEWLDIGLGYEAAYQDNTGNLWSAGTDNHGDWAQQMKPGTSPAITLLLGGGYEMAYQDNNGHLWTTGTAGTTEWGLANVMAGTSPAITDLYGGGYEVAFQANTGHLWSVGSGGGSDNHGDWGLGMMAGTSPAITYQADGYEVAFQANTGNLWTAGPAGTRNWGLGMMAGTSPAITSLLDGGYEMAFQANTGDLWSWGSGGGADHHGNWGLGMWDGTNPTITGPAGTSPAITGLAGGGYEMAFQAAGTGDLWTVGAGGGSDNHGDWGLQMGISSPAITGLLRGGYEVAISYDGAVYTVGSGGGSDLHGFWGGSIMPGTSPSIEAPIFGIG
jgi:hypothetical protein